MLHKTRNLGWITPAGSESLATAAHAAKYFPRRMHGAIMVALEAQPETPSVVADVVSNWSKNVSHTILQDQRVKSFAPIVMGYFLDGPGGHPMANRAKAEFLSQDQRMTVILVQPTASNGDWNAVNALLQQFCSSAPAGYIVHITGMAAVAYGDGCFEGRHAKVNTRDMNLEVLYKAEMCTLPLALIITGYIVWYLRLLVLPVLVLSVSYVLTCFMLLPLMDTVPIPKDVAASVGSVSLAFCLDYSLFFLSRFGEHHRQGWHLQQNVDTLVRCTGRTISVSGTLVAIAFFGSVLMPEQCIRSAGIALGLAAVSCVIACLFIIPSVLLTTGTVLTGSTFRHPFPVKDVQLDSFNNREEMSMESTGKEQDEKLSNYHWMSAMRFVDQSPHLAVFLVFLLMSPLLWHLPQLSITGDRFALLPMEMPAMLAMNRVHGSFPVGILDPYSVVITAPNQSQGSNEIQGTLEALGKRDTANMAKAFGVSPEEATLASGIALRLISKQHDAEVSAGMEGSREVESLREKMAAELSTGVEVVRSDARQHNSSMVAIASRDVAGLEAQAHGQKGLAELVSLGGTAAPDAAALAERIAAKVPASLANLTHEVAALNQSGTIKAVGSGVSENLGRRRLSDMDVLKKLRGSAVTDSTSQQLATTIADAVPSVLNSTSASHVTAVKDAQTRWTMVLDLAQALSNMSNASHGTLLMPSGFAAMMDLCDKMFSIGKVSSMLGPAWVFQQRVDWATALALNTNSGSRGLYSPMLHSHVNGRRGLLEVHTTFPSIGAGSTNWVVNARTALKEWEAAHPGYSAELSGGNCPSVDTRDRVFEGMKWYLTFVVCLIMLVVLATYRSVMVPLRLAFALLFTLGATYGAGIIIYQTPLLHGMFPFLIPFDGIVYETVPLVTGVCIALGLDYDIFLVSRIVEFRTKGYTDRASVFRGGTKAGSVITGAGVIMALSFSGLCFSDKLFFQQFGTLLVISVLFDTFVVRTVLVPALMLIAAEWNWWPREMPPGIYDTLEGEEDSTTTDGTGYRPMLD